MITKPKGSHAADGIAELHVATWRSAYRGQMPDSFLEALRVERRAEFWRKELARENHGIIVAEERSSLLGFGSLIPSRDSDSDATVVGEIAALYVSSARWREGIGRALMVALLESAFASHYSIITLWVLAANAPSIQFYEAAGFRRDGTAKSETLSGGFIVHEIRMRRRR